MAFPVPALRAPYPGWGPPFGGLGGGTGGYPYSGGGFGGGGFPFFPGFPGFPGGFPSVISPPAVNFAQPWLDGHYPSYDFRDRSPYWKPYVVPTTPPTPAP